MEHLSLHDKLRRGSTNGATRSLCYGNRGTPLTHCDRQLPPPILLTTDSSSQPTKRNDAVPYSNSAFHFKSKRPSPKQAYSISRMADGPTYQAQEYRKAAPRYLPSRQDEQQEPLPPIRAVLPGLTLGTPPITPNREGWAVEPSPKAQTSHSFRFGESHFSPEKRARNDSVYYPSTHEGNPKTVLPSPTEQITAQPPGSLPTSDYGRAANSAPPLARPSTPTRSTGGRVWEYPVQPSAYLGSNTLESRPTYGAETGKGIPMFSNLPDREDRSRSPRYVQGSAAYRSRLHGRDFELRRSSRHGECRSIPERTSNDSYPYECNSRRGSYDRVSTAWPLPREAGSDHIAHTVTQSNSNTYCNGHQRLPLFYGQQPSHVAYGIYDDNPHRYTFAAHGAADSNGQRRRRGNLPKEATRMFKDWFEANIQSPYPSEDLKLQFCEQTGLTMNQVGNWFINQRRRTPLLRHKREEPLANDGSDES